MIIFRPLPFECKNISSQTIYRSKVYEKNQSSKNVAEVALYHFHLHCRDKHMTKQLIEKEFVLDYDSRRLRVCHGEEVSQQGEGVGAGT